MMGELIMRCFHARTNAHILHLKSRSYAQHVALEEFYEGLLPLVDSIAEGYQGDYGLIESYPGKYTQAADALAMLEELGGWIMDHRYDVAKKEDTCLQNVIDELIHLIYTTQYKLKFLK
jgi:hypothetical protein